jgi:hypothetical protein
MPIPEGPVDELTYPRAAARIFRTIQIIGAAGIVMAFLAAGWQSAAGFALGAFISALNFYMLRRLIDSIGSAAAGQSPPRNRAVVLGFRYLIVGLGAYVILRLTPISLTAVLAGVFVLTAAVFVEVAFEIYYARK